MTAAAFDSNIICNHSPVVFWLRSPPRAGCRGMLYHLIAMFEAVKKTVDSEASCAGDEEAGELAEDGAAAATIESIITVSITAAEAVAGFGISFGFNFHGPQTDHY